MIAHILRAIFKRIDRCIDAHVAAALADPIPPVEVAHMERTPIGDASWLAAIQNACRIEVACEEWAAEVDALADVELAELTREDGR